MSFVLTQPPKRDLSRWIRRTWRQLKRERLTPGRFGFAVGLGLFFGLSPFWGLQMIVAQLLAHIFKLNRLAVAAAVSVSSPPLLPFEVALSVYLGEWLIRGRSAHFSFGELFNQDILRIARNFGSSFIVGALALAALVSIPAGFFAAWRMKRAVSNRSFDFSLEQLEGFDDAVARLPRRLRQYARWKLWLDPVYKMVAPKLVARREVLDLGAGLGVLAFFVKQLSPQTRVRCVEWDAEKAAAAKLFLSDPTPVECGDARAVELGQPDAIVLLDVLHYSPPEVQKVFLSRCAAALSSDGMLVIRELSKRSSVAEWFEVQAVRRGWNKGQGVFLWPMDDLVAFLEQHSFTVETVPAGRGLFTANTLIFARKA